MSAAYFRESDGNLIREDFRSSKVLGTLPTVHTGGSFVQEKIVNVIGIFNEFWRTFLSLSFFLEPSIYPRETHNRDILVL